jgi:hypothetical protein
MKAIALFGLAACALLLCRAGSADAVASAQFSAPATETTLAAQLATAAGACCIGASEQYVQTFVVPPVAEIDSARLMALVPFQVPVLASFIAVLVFDAVELVASFVSVSASKSTTFAAALHV